MSEYKAVAVCGNVNTPSRTRVLVDHIVGAIQQLTPLDVHTVELTKIGHQLGRFLVRKHLPLELESELRRIETADLLVVGSPVYRGSYTGLFKHMFDLVDHKALRNTVVVLAATGANERHTLMLDHQLRPLFSFFRAYTVPTPVYATEADYEDYRLLFNEELFERINTAAAQAIRFLYALHC